MASAALLIIILSLAFKTCVGDDTYSPQGLSIHIDTLLAEYDREVPPESKVIITLSMDLRFASIMEHEGIMRILADMSMCWKDPRLSWNSTTYGGESVMVSLERIWNPDITLLNAAGTASMDESGASRVRLTNEGDIISMVRMDLTAPVTLQLANWPYDTHEAIFKFASREHTDEEIELEIENFKSPRLVESGIWDGKEISSEVTTWERSDGSSVSVANAGVSVGRRGMGLAAVASSVFLGAQLLLAAAAVRPCAVRPPLAAAAAIVTIIWLISAIFHIPAAGTVPRVVHVVCGVCVLSGLSGVAAAVTARIARRTSPPPALLRNVLTRVSAVYSLTPDPDSAGENGAWAAASRLIDAVFITLQLITQLVLLIVYF